MSDYKPGPDIYPHTLLFVVTRKGKCYNFQFNDEEIKSFWEWYNETKTKRKALEEMKGEFKEFSR